MAIDCVDQVLALRGPPVYVYHEIVHNRHVVNRFERKGVTFVDDVNEVPTGGVVVYSAHGISPTIRAAAKERNLIEVDATCPLVTKVHMEVIRYARDGYTILFIGHRNHDEAVGTVGEAPGNVIVVESPEEVAALNLADTSKLAFVTQTTLSVSEASRTIAALMAKFPNIRYPAKEDICYATTNRQAAVTDLAEQADVVLVVGSQNSSNSKRLVETAKEQGKPGYLIDDEAELDSAWLAGASSVLVTAGASAPDDLVQALLERLREEFGGVVETYTLVEEDVSFELPKSVKRLLVLN
jgi:4-hydroxy-3-methylbut-2-enyl diphosphate reductase